MIANTLIHREFTSSYTAKFVIEKDRMYTENANRSSGDGIITPDNMEPNQNNPIIASFFRNIGWSDRLGSGVRNIFKYSKNYKKILEFMEEGKEYTIQDFCNLLNLKPSRTKELLKALTQDIEQIGNNKNRKYRLK